VMLVWLAGHYFSKHEQLNSSSVVAARLIGAILIAIAITFVMW